MDNGKAMTVREAAIASAREDIRAELLGAGRSTEWVRQHLAVLEWEAPVAAPPAPWSSSGITLTARQLANAMEFAAPDFAADEEQRDTVVTIAWAPAGAVRDDDGKPEPAGLVVWITDYPEEGSLPLPDTYSGPLIDPGGLSR